MSRKLTLGNPPPKTAPIEKRVDWAIRAIETIARGSRDIDIFDIADNFAPTNVTPTRAFDPATATLSELGNVVGTILIDTKQRGPKRTTG